MNEQFKRGDIVLVRNSTRNQWECDTFVSYNKYSIYAQYECLRGIYKFCVPCSGNSLQRV